MEASIFLNLQMETIVTNLNEAFEHLSTDRYILPLPLLSGSSIGEHTRHIVEFFQCIGSALEPGTLDYSKRARNRQIEMDKNFALERLTEATQRLNLPNRQMVLYLNEGGDSTFSIPSNLYREIAYNIEHAIHHMAIIKIGLKSLGIAVADDFGVAPSTLQYRAACVS
jgi:uncharacterized damage-inducible protein DinB